MCFDRRPRVVAQQMYRERRRQRLAVHSLARPPSPQSSAQRQCNVRESGVGLTLLFNEPNTIWIDLQRRCSLAQEKRVKSHQEHIRSRVLLYDRAPKERLLTSYDFVRSTDFRAF